MKIGVVIRILSLEYLRMIERIYMNTKLTLKLNKKAIDRAKKYAQRNKQSLSIMVEKYFNLISDKESITEIEISPNVLELSGIIKLPKHINLKEAYRDHIEAKYSK
ncbi:MAG: hypothetical protein JETCAE03_22630 [Ignavibacteriaceae bacterium]|nr:MAG: hypothetical protein BroJett017_28140 [Ignavibacteriota bacterium]GJQ42765.1 MAG: hypothetical protein JETCAE03_22630 [Ignavibacteriaceae bacterium]